MSPQGLYFMSNQILIDASHPEETRVVVVRDNRIGEYDFESEHKKQIKNNIYLARVTRIEPSLQAAFVEYGGNKHGFLAFSEIHPDYYQIPQSDKQALMEQKENKEESLEDNFEENSESSEIDDISQEIEKTKPTALTSKYKIQEVIKRRQILLVQVIKEERGNKGAGLTTYLSLAGRYSVLMPNTNSGGGISKKITNSQDRKRLKEIIKNLKISEGMSIILRTAGANRTKTEIKRDYDYLARLWNNIKECALNSIAPSLVHEEGSLIKRSIRDLYDKTIDQILVSGDAAYKEAKSFIRMLMPSHTKVVQPYNDPVPIFSKNNIESELDKMLQPQVHLKSGGYLVMNQTEALVAIDVNSGRSTKESSIEETAYQTNLEAAEEIALQLRLRDLAGLIVIDFIDMEEKKNIRSVEARLKTALKLDRARIQIGSISPFGLLEMSRQRLRASVLESTTHLCPECEGSGYIRSQSSIALSVIRAIEDYLFQNSSHDISVKMSISTALYIFNHKRQTITDLENRFKLSITILQDNFVGPQHFLIENLSLSEHSLSQNLLNNLEKELVNQTTKQNKKSNKMKIKNEDQEAQKNNQLKSSEKNSSLKKQKINSSSDSKEQKSEADLNSPKKRRRGRRGGKRNKQQNINTLTEQENYEAQPQPKLIEVEKKTEDHLPEQEALPQNEEKAVKKAQKISKKKSDNLSQKEKDETLPKKETRHSKNKTKKEALSNEKIENTEDAPQTKKKSRSKKELSKENVKKIENQDVEEKETKTKKSEKTTKVKKTTSIRQKKEENKEVNKEVEDMKEKKKSSKPKEEKDEKMKKPRKKETKNSSSKT